MADDSSAELLSRLRAEGDRSLRSFLRRSAPLTPTPGASRAMGRVKGPAEGEEDEETSGSGATDGEDRETSGSGAIDGDAEGELTLPGNERKVRALAKEIKHLIGEDKRRGLSD